MSKIKTTIFKDSLLGKKLTFALCLILVLLFGITSLFVKPKPALAAVGINQQMNYQARLYTSSGATVADGNYNIRFKIYQDGDGVLGGGDETLLWTEKWQNSNSQGVVIKNGYFSVQLGSICAFTGGSCQGNTNTSIDWNQSIIWLSIDIGQGVDATSSAANPTYDGEMSPFKRLSASPYALNSNQLGGIAASGFVQLQGSTPGIQQTGHVNVSGTIIGATALQSPAFDTASAGALAIGNTNATSLSLCNSAACDTINIGTNTDADAINIGDSSDTITITGNSSSTLVLDGVTISAAELNRLDGKDAALVDTNDAVNTAITGVGALTTGSIGSGFGTISTANTITGTTLNGTTGINTGAGAGTQRIDSSGNLVNVGGITMSGNFSQTGSTTFGTGTGAISLNGDTTLASGKNFIQNGAGTFGTGTGAVSLNGSTTVASGKSITLAGGASNILATGASTATTATTSGTGTNTTTVTLTGSAFANNDTIFIDNAGQDYYTRIVSGGGTATLTVSPAVTYETSRTVTKYTLQNIGATTTDYSTLSNRFFEGYFLGGVVTGAGSTTLSDGRLGSTGALNINASSVNVKNTSDSVTSFRVQNAAGTTVLNVDTTNGHLGIGTAAPSTKLTIAETSSTSLTNIQQTITSNILHLEGTYGSGTNYQGGLVWSTSDNNGTKPKAGIWLQASVSGSYLQFGTSNAYATGINNVAISIDPSGNTQTRKLDAQSLSGAGGYISSGNYAGTGSAAWFPSGLYSAGTNWLYGTINSNGSYVDVANSRTLRDANGGWVRTYDASGWYNGTWGGGIHMQDSTYVRVYGGKYFVTSMPSGGATLCTAFGVIYACASDSRLKDDISYLQDSSSPALDKVRQLKPATFNWKEGHGDGNDVGFIAQDVMQLFPELVKINEDGYYSFDNSKMVPYAVKAIQELDAEVSSLKIQVAASLQGDAGGLQNGDVASFSTLTVTGNSTLETLTVNKDAVLKGDTLTLSDNTRGINQEIPASGSSVHITFDSPHPNADYAVWCTPNYNSNCYITNKQTTGFDANFGVPAAPDGSGRFDWLVVR